MIIKKRTGPKSVIRHLGLPEIPFMYGSKTTKKRRVSKLTEYTKNVRRRGTMPLRQREKINSYFYKSNISKWRNIYMREMSNFMTSRQSPPNFNRNILSFSTAELNESNRQVSQVIRELNRRKWRKYSKLFAATMIRAGNERKVEMERQRVERERERELYEMQKWYERDYLTAMLDQKELK